MPDAGTRAEARTADWFRTHTHRASDFDVEELVRRLDGRTVSVLLPARNEESTVGAIVARVQEELVDRAPLVAEIVVIDSCSTDDTARVAKEAGARVVHVDEVLPDLGSRPGKGEALWKAVATMTGEIGVFLDADVEDFDSSFVTGLLGPLLLDRGVGFVKGFYDRPWQSGGTRRHSGGGRVTELVARPLINREAPLLAGFVQPLAGECAFRREVLLDVPFVTGYGVDIGLMLDVLDDHGLDAMAQVDLGVRLHRHQDIRALAAMSAQVRGAFALRCGAAGPVAGRPVTERVSERVTGFGRDESGTTRQQVETVVTELLPPLRHRVGDTA